MKIKLDNGSKPKYSLKGYLKKIQMACTKILLVEGEEDRIAINSLLYEYSLKNESKHNVVIDLSEIVSDDKLYALGEREKIEKIYDVASVGLSSTNKFYVFVDREYRNFDTNTISDNLPTHFIEGNLFWTRGHSIQNYFFSNR